MNPATLDANDSFQQRGGGEYSSPLEVAAFTDQRHYSHEDVPEQIQNNMQPYQYSSNSDRSQEDHIIRAQWTNNQIMGHRMSNMNTFQPMEPPPMQTQAEDRRNHIQFDNNIQSDSATAPRLRSDPTPRQRMPQHQPANHMNEGPAPQHQQNARGCRCGPKQNYCGVCMVCGHPGHIRPVPGKSYSSKLAAWCDPHYEGAKRAEMKRNPSGFLSYQTYEFNPSSINPDNPQHSLGPPLTINPNAAQFKNAPKIPSAANNGISINQHMANTNYHHDSILGPDQMYSHHSDRQLSSGGQQLGGGGGGGPNQMRPRQQQNPTSLPPNAPNPYQLTPENMGNFKGGHNSFALHRTSIKPGTLGPVERIDYVGFNAQGEKVRNPNYYRETPGRVNEFDHYREYKSKFQSGDYQPSNQHTMNSQYRPYQGNIPPKKAKLSGDNLQTLQK